ncbi:MAG: PaaI family thioesterase [Candidatus Dormibacteraceae bacterium]
MKVVDDRHCFGCGPENPHGLKLCFERREEESWAEFSVPERFQSWQGIIHGGMVSLVLDEAMGWAAWHAGCPGVTGKLEVRLRQPLRVGEAVRVRARLIATRGRLISASAYLERLADSVKVAEATASLMRVPVEISAPRS